ncbi:chemotaxis-specific protein-glutamate methyltransferase CheB [Geomobilimonas luticola]|uniref:Protein-glutamate methylesterase/protein-glutamine glutaminase n=1 Tax=Geomobilimonas luticola TaxID=1114878 RepID=A0ABS5S9U6_9BACT|nr:chemotaxis-specific protein-glutamate methyltransferase CheB [Geomobilimonas luticola]MBT0652147.1 chemotaxis-specific protein-glutamate methyltransferase CheB [Geomobilimonas luticola]
MIKVLLADDSPLVRAVLKDIFAATDDIRVIGEAADGREAVELAAHLRPDLIVMDLMMPVLDGLAAIEEIMSGFPAPILVLSGTLDDHEVNRAFAAIKKGALDVMSKPDGGGLTSPSEFSAGIVEKVRLLARIRVIRRPSRHREQPAPPPLAGGRKILAIGASTGGPKAVMSIVRKLPADFRGTVLIVQHIASGFDRGFAQWLDGECPLKVRLAAEGDALKEGEVLVAPTDCHLMVVDGRTRLTYGPQVNCCRPSIDVLFSSLVPLGSQVVGVLLTGMGKDGAQGLRGIKEQGGVTIVQDEQSCAVFGMPKAAISLEAADRVLPLDAIPAAIIKLFANSTEE